MSLVHNKTLEELGQSVDCTHFATPPSGTVTSTRVGQGMLHPAKAKKLTRAKASRTALAVALLG